MLTGYSQEEYSRCSQAKDKRTLSPNTSPIILDDNDTTVNTATSSKGSVRGSKKRPSGAAAGPSSGSRDHSGLSTSDYGSIVKRVKLQSSEKDIAQWERIEKKKQKAMVCIYM